MNLYDHRFHQFDHPSHKSVQVKWSLENLRRDLERKYIYGRDLNETVSFATR